MVSDKQIEANQENAVLGGVKTPEGKAVSKFRSQYAPRRRLARSLIAPNEIPQA